MSKRLNMLGLTSAALLLSLSWTDSALAQQPARSMPAPDVDRSSCTDINWHRDMLQEYPWVADACHEAVVVDGQKWARFEAEFQELNRDGTITSDFRDDRGRSLGTVNLRPGPDQQVMMDGRRTNFSDLRRGQVLNFYATEGQYTFATEPNASVNEQIEIVQRQSDQRSRELTRSEPASDRRASRLPATAGPLPMLAFGGMLSLLGGLTLTMRRRLRTPSA